MECPNGVKEYETESKDFWQYCYDCPYLERVDSSLDSFTCGLKDSEREEKI